MNPFETGERKVIPASLIYASSKGRILMLHRNTRPSDRHAGKWNGIGGKFEIDESPLEAARREFHEEAGVELPETAFRSIGILHFPHFQPSRDEDWTVWVFLADMENLDPSDPSLRQKCPEGELHWIERSEILSLNLWEGDKLFIPFVLEGRPFVGTFWYKGDRLERHWVQPLARPIDSAARTG